MVTGVMTRFLRCLMPGHVTRAKRGISLRLSCLTRHDSRPGSCHLLLTNNDHHTMLIAKTESDRVKLYDAKTGNLKLSLPVGGQTAGTALVQGDTIVVPVRDGDKVRTRIYDARTGNIKLNIP